MFSYECSECSALTSLNYSRLSIRRRSPKRPKDSTFVVQGIVRRQTLGSLTVTMEANLKRLAEENAGLATEATALRARLDRVHARLANLPPQPQRSNTKAKTAAPTQSKETPVSRVPANAKQPSSAGSGAGAETTERLYFADTYAFTAEASVVAVAEADGKHVLILDKTVRLPRSRLNQCRHPASSAFIPQPHATSLHPRVDRPMGRHSDQFG